MCIQYHANPLPSDRCPKKCKETMGGRRAQAGTIARSAGAPLGSQHKETKDKKTPVSLSQCRIGASPHRRLARTPNRDYMVAA
jgi:hypothetical protein